MSSPSSMPASSSSASVPLGANVNESYLAAAGKADTSAVNDEALLTDTHCHIHEESYADKEAAYERAIKAGVKRLICVGTDEHTSREAVEFAGSHDNVWASVGLHPHDAKSGREAVADLEKLILDDLQSNNMRQPRVTGGGAAPAFALSPMGVRKEGAGRPAGPAGNLVAVGECGLDYFYDNSPRDKQIEILHAQLELAQKYDLPVIFHVREAFDDFWPIFDQYSSLSGVLHSFTDSKQNVEQALERGLYIGVNGISTFAKSEAQQAMYAAVPLESLLLETDSPFLTPVPHRGTLNEPAFITHVAQHIANLQSINLQELSRATERNATKLFSI